MSAIEDSRVAGQPVCALPDTPFLAPVFGAKREKDRKPPSRIVSRSKLPNRVQPTNADRSGNALVVLSAA